MELYGIREKFKGRFLLTLLKLKLEEERKDSGWY